MEQSELPVAVIGAGPVGLTAAAHLVVRGLTPLVLEAGETVGASMRRWGHVRVFSPWRYNIDPVAAEMLAHTGWTAPDGDAFPAGREILARYLEPLAALPQIAPHLRCDARVISVSRLGFDKMKSEGRESASFVLQVETPSGEERVLARAVIDASGTWEAPNPLGAGGIPAIGERSLAGSIFYGIPDALGPARERYAGRRVLVVGSGHSSFNALIDLVKLSREAPGTEITWVVRRAVTAQLYGGETRDALPARGSLGKRVRQYVQRGDIRLVTGFKVARLQHGRDGILVESEQGETVGPFDEIVATTGFRPNLTMLSELRLALDPAVESPVALAPLIDPNVHSCGTVRPHGVEELRHPEVGFYIAGMKSYGRAPTFLMRTGYEQVRSIAAALAGDWESARKVELELPETGVCALEQPETDAADYGAGECEPVGALARAYSPPSCC